jgi:hypothetical protein
MTRQTRNSDPAAPTVVQDAILLDPLVRSAKDAPSKLSTKGGGRGGEKKRRQSDWLANQIDRKVMDRQVIDRQVEDRQTGRNRPMSAGTQADRAAS